MAKAMLPLGDHERLHGAQVQARLDGQHGDVLLDGDGDVDDNGWK